MIFSAKRAICFLSQQAQANFDGKPQTNTRPFFTTLLPFWKMSQLFFKAAQALEMLDLMSINEDLSPQTLCSPYANYVRLELRSASILGLVENRPTLAITIFFMRYMRNTSFTKVNQILCVRF